MGSSGQGAGSLDRPASWRASGIVLAVMAATALIERALGRVPWCTCGTIKLWHGVVQSSENSQHLTDWYTFTHVLHGALFYAALWVLACRLPVRMRFVLAVCIEAVWEVIENSPFIIDRYRAATISLDYYGDSIVNSLFDILAMMLGFFVANRLPAWTTAALVVGTEMALAVAIRDNLTLNILMLVHPVAAIKAWQLGP